MLGTVGELLGYYVTLQYVQSQILYYLVLLLTRHMKLLYLYLCLHNKQADKAM